MWKKIIFLIFCYMTSDPLLNYKASKCKWMGGNMYDIIYSSFYSLKTNQDGVFITMQSWVHSWYYQLWTCRVTDWCYDSQCEVRGSCSISMVFNTELHATIALCLCLTYWSTIHLLWAGPQAVKYLLFSHVHKICVAAVLFCCYMELLF